MRLLKVNDRGELSLTQDLHKAIPPYAILSHTWGEEAEEVTLDDLNDGTGARKVGYTKIRFCADQARKDGLQYFWVDTCCIDKKNQSELAEAVVSMFRWYAGAERCYVFLSDVSTRKRDNTGSIHCWESTFRKSRWHERGWTLQEMLAPGVVEFFSRQGERLGDKRTLEQMIHEITDIPTAALRGRPLSSFSAEERLHWVSRRQTTRSEDKAYCLLGIFDVAMPPIYGEGDKAFVRLKDEIAKSYRRQLEGIGRDAATTNSSHRDITDTGTAAMSMLDRRKVLMASLGFEQMDSRRSTIKNADSTTCQWLFQHPAYMAWIDPEQLDQHRGFLWINGKPGAGKSTLIKFAHANAASKKHDHEIRLSYFFNARGEELEKSTVGMYRALLFQLLNTAVDMQELLDGLCPSLISHVDDHSWTLEELSKLLFAAIGQLGKRRLKCFVDALDECDEQQVQEMIILFEDLGQIAVQNGTELYICFASRHFPVIDIRNGRQLILEDEIGHSEDLAMYVQRHLRAGKGKLVEEVRMQIREKANGVFLWAVLVVGILNKEFKSGRVWAVKKRLQEIPPELGDLFKDILRRDSANMDEFLLCLQWILFAKQPLRREEFYYAMLSGLEPDSEEMTVWDPDRVTEDFMGKFVLTSSKGFAELTKSRMPTVQFIHESVRDFFIKDRGLHELWPALGDDLYGLCHDRLKRCCLSYLNVDISSHVAADEMLHKASSDNARNLKRWLTAKFPFLEYASHSVLYHANEAASVILQDDFLSDFPLNTWIQVTNLLERYDNHRHTSTASLLYVLAENNFARLIRTTCQSGPTVGARGERYNYPLFVALVNGHQAAVRALLFLQEDALVPIPTEDISTQALRQTFSAKTLSPLLWALENEYEALADILISSVDFYAVTGDAKVKEAFLKAAEKGHEKVVNSLMATNGLNTLWRPISRFVKVATGHKSVRRLLFDQGIYIETHNLSVGDTALIVAARHGKDSIVQALLNAGAGIAEADDTRRTALVMAAKHGMQSTVQTLLENGVDVEPTERVDESALTAAASNGHVSIVRILLEEGIDLEATDGLGRTALLNAVIRECSATVQLLLDEGADVNVADTLGNTALLFAAKWNNDTGVHSLLSRGASINHVNQCGQTALSLAAKNSNSISNTRFLLDHGASIEAIDTDGRTPLHHAAMRSSIDTVQLLLERNADVNAVDKEGRTALHYAVKRDDPFEDSSLAKAELLLDWGASIKATDREGKTVLHCAAASSWTIWATQTVQLLLERGADVDAVDSNGLTALDWAVKQSQVVVAQFLRDSGRNRCSLPDSAQINRQAWHMTEEVPTRADPIAEDAGSSVGLCPTLFSPGTQWSDAGCEQLEAQPSTFLSSCRGNFL
ncbi:hypothetical protein H2200_011948 [Cladophialophora chaetospira]|uniref:Heterokaryon incompatibility domain-containing protein n=1 Tax=Cladophialophora chaetospira TaxID=386627 RepID=A0AA38WZ03_9EURO|nr:hypothetical protein H2200_011948 [Cladophialophora chaetospira]